MHVKRQFHTTFVFKVLYSYQLYFDLNFLNYNITVATTLS